MCSLLKHAIALRDESGEYLKGKVRVSGNETLWRFFLLLRLPWLCLKTNTEQVGFNGLLIHVLFRPKVSI